MTTGDCRPIEARPARLRRRSSSQRVRAHSSKASATGFPVAMFQLQRLARALDWVVLKKLAHLSLARAPYSPVCPRRSEIKLRRQSGSSNEVSPRLRHPSRQLLGVKRRQSLVVVRDAIENQLRYRGIGFE